MRNDMKKVIIRDATKEDLNTISELLEILMGGKVPWENTDIKEVYKWVDNINADKAFRLMVAEYQGKVVGTLQATIIPNPARELAPFCYLENLIVHPDGRNLGVARSLINEAENWAITNNCCKLQLISGVKWKEAHKLYESSGFDVDVIGFEKRL